MVVVLEGGAIINMPWFAQVPAIVMAASGNSNAPGTQATALSASATPRRSSSASAPERSRLVTCPLKRLQTTAIRSPVPSPEPRAPSPSISSIAGRRWVGVRATRRAGCWSRSTPGVSSADAIEVPGVADGLLCGHLGRSALRREEVEAAEQVA